MTTIAARCPVRPGDFCTLCVPGATGPADAMNIVFGRIGQLVIHHAGKLFDVEAARRDIGRHKHRREAALELRKRLLPFRLAAVAVYCGRDDAFARKFARQAIGVAFHAHEYQHL